MKLIRILAFVAVLAASLTAIAQETGKMSEDPARHADLQKQLWALDQQWLYDVQNRKMDLLNQMWTDQFVETLPGGKVVNKAEQMKMLATVPRKPGTGSTRSGFRLLADYGNVVLATDHMTQKGTKAYGHDITGGYQTVRVFVKEDGKWRGAESALCRIGLPSSMAASHATDEKTVSSARHAGLEKQLWNIEQKWLEAARTQNLDVLKQLWTNQFFEMLPGGHSVNKSELLDMLAKTDRGPGIGAFPDDFKLRANYGNFAIATDHTTLKGVSLAGQNLSGKYRVVRFFVKEHGTWKVAGAAFIAITA